MCRWEKWGRRRVRKLPTIKQQVREEPWMQAQVCLMPESVDFPLGSVNSINNRGEPYITPNNLLLFALESKYGEDGAWRPREAHMRPLSMMAAKQKYFICTSVKCYCPVTSVLMIDLGILWKSVGSMLLSIARWHTWLRSVRQALWVCRWKPTYQVAYVGNKSHWSIFMEVGQTVLIPMQHPFSFLPNRTAIYFFRMAMYFATLDLI